MYKLKIFDIKKFKRDLASLKEKHIILFENDGYYRPSSQQEYVDFINKQKDTIESIKKTILIAEKEIMKYE